MLRDKMVKLSVTLLLAACGGAQQGPDASGADAAESVRSYQITITNLTGGQPLSPPVLATHPADAHLFQQGAMASEGIRLIAEQGDNTAEAAALRADARFYDVVASKTVIHRIGGPASNVVQATIKARGEARYLSIASMLGCTNDGLTGVDAVELPAGSAPMTLRAGSYDAGTEANDELFTHIPDGCNAAGPVTLPPDGQDLRTATAEPIAAHPGVKGQSDAHVGLSAPHQWTDPVIEIAIQRVL